MPEKISEHVDHEQHGAYQIKYCSDNSIPESLSIALLRSYRWYKLVHRSFDCDQLWKLDNVQKLHSSGLTIAVAAYHKMIVSGRAMIYRIRLVKFNNKNMFPVNPSASEHMLRA